MSSLGLYRPTKLASTSYSVSLCGLLIVSEEDITEQEGGFFVDIDESSLGFPGGSLGRHGTDWLGYVIVGLLGHILDHVV